MNGEKEAGGSLLIPMRIYIDGLTTNTLNIESGHDTEMQQTGSGIRNGCAML